MIPIKLTLSGFLSYRDLVEVDFTLFDLACISGQNGAGKSSLLDAITWVLFGQARKKDDTLIHTACDRAEVTFVFEYEQNIYRIQRSMPRGKTNDLQLQIKDQNVFRPFSEPTLRGTQTRIQSILRMDYETFINASFFLQGKADQFTQQRPTERKKILASILGLDIWETYREQVVHSRRDLETNSAVLDSQINELNRELAEEAIRTTRLRELESSLAEAEEMRKTREAYLASVKQVTETIRHQQNTVDNLASQLTRLRANLNAIQNRKTQRNAEKEQYTSIIQRAAEVEHAHTNWVASRTELEHWENLGSQFRAQDATRQEPLSRLSIIHDRLQQEQNALVQKEAETTLREESIITKKAQHRQLQSALSNIDLRLKSREGLRKTQSQITLFREKANQCIIPQSEINTEKARLQNEIKLLQSQNEAVENQRSGLITLNEDLQQAKNQLAQTEAQLNKRKEYEQQAQTKRDENSRLQNENDMLKVLMKTLRDRITRLENTEGATCPLCGQPLGEQDRLKLIAELTAEGLQKKEEYQNNQNALQRLQHELAEISKEIENFARTENDHRYHLTNISKLEERIRTNQGNITEWENTGAATLLQLQEKLKNEDYCLTARETLASMNLELEAIAHQLGLQAATQPAMLYAVQSLSAETEQELSNLKDLDDTRIQTNIQVSTLNEQINRMIQEQHDWQNTGLPRLNELNDILSNQAFGMEERQKLAEIDAIITAIGYDPGAHELCRQAELAGRSAESDLRAIQSAIAALSPLERELEDIQNQIGAYEADLNDLQSNHESESARLQELKTSVHDIRQAETMLLDAQEKENILNREVGAAQQKVKVLPELRKRKNALEENRTSLSRQIINHKTLERAFGKDGVPALLIEQALPQIEEKANELLDRLSAGTMNIRFATQAEYKDKKREDMKETLDILISDGAGTRDYEMFSGGEAFRVNFAIRLALSEILAQRTGARLQTLVIDEGFGSQDVQGRQRLIEAINQVKSDFAKILIITHLEELKEAFPNRLEVEKTLRGSTVRVQ